MGVENKENAQESDKDASSPLPYTEEQSGQALPQYRNVESATHISTTCSPYRAFPPTMRAQTTWKHWKSFNLCDKNSSEPLFHVSVHTGYSGKPPLGERPGLNLHNGPSRSDPILAATGDESQMASKVYSFNNNSVVLLPALEPNRNYIRVDSERMCGAPSDEHEATFSFAVEVGKKERRAKFEWRKIKMGVDGSPKSISFQLMRLPSRRLQNTQPVAEGSGGSRGGGSVGGEGSQQAGPSYPASSAQPNIGCEAVAMLKLDPPLSWAKFFTLELLGSASSGELGDRATLMIVATAMRLCVLRVNGKTTKTFNTTAEKMRRPH